MRLFIGFFLLGLAWSQPVHIFPWLSWHSELLGFLAALVMGWEVVYLATKRPPSASGGLTVPTAAVPILFLSAIVLLQWATGRVHFGGDAIVLSAYFGLCVFGLSAGFTGGRKDEEIVLGLALTLAVGACFSAIVELAQAFEVWDALGWIFRAQYARRPGANLGQPNQLATLLLMGGVGCVYLFERHKLSVLLATLLMALLCVGLAATESKSGMLSLMLLATWWFAKRKSIAFRSSAWCAVIYGLAFLSLFLLWPLFMQEVFQYKTDITAFNSPIALNRWVVWPQLIHAVMLRPWFGWGFGQVSTAHNAVVDAYPRSEAYSYAHNIALDFAIGLGLPLTIIFVSLAGGWLWQRIRMVQTLDTWYCIAVITPVAVHSMFEYPFAYSYFLLPIMLAIGMLECKVGAKSAFQLGVKPLFVGLAIMTAAFIWSAREYIAIEEDFQVVRFEASHIGKPPEYYQRPTVHLFTQLNALLDAMRIVPRPNMPGHEIEVARLAALHFPMIATQNRYALALALNSNPIEAVRQLRVMRAQQEPRTYAKIKGAWAAIAEEQYPELRELQLP